MSTRCLRSHRARLVNVNNENSSNKKVNFVDNARVSLTKSDKTKIKSNKKNVPKSVNLLNNSNSKTLRNKPNSTTVDNNTSSEEKPLRKKRKSNSKEIPASSPSNVKSPLTKPSHSSPKKGKLENNSSTAISTSKENAQDTSQIKSKIPLRNAPKTKVNKIRQQMKLGRIFIKPNFPLKSILKKNINSSDKQRKQGQSTKQEREANNNIVKRLEPRILLQKIDHRKVSPARRVHEYETRSRRTLRGNR